MSDEGRTDEDSLNLAAAPARRRGPGAFAWVSLTLFVLALAAFLFAVAVGAYGGAIVTFFAVLGLSVPTLILMGAWIEVHIDDRGPSRVGLGLKPTVAERPAERAARSAR